MGRGYSLSIGINRFKADGGVNPLKFAMRDAICWFRFFLLHGYHAELLLESDATFDNIIGALADIADSLTPGDHVICTYSGHGIEATEHGQMLLAYDTNVGLWDRSPRTVRTGLSATLFQEMTQKSNVNRLLLLDACRDQIRAHKGRTIDSGYSRNLSNVLDAAPLGSPLSILASCHPGQQSQEFPALRGGLFTRSVLDVFESELKSGVDLRLTGAIQDRIRQRQSELCAIYQLGWVPQAPWVLGGCPDLVLAAPTSQDSGALPVREDPPQPVSSPARIEVIAEPAKVYSPQQVPLSGNLPPHLRVFHPETTVGIGGLARGSGAASQRQVDWCREHRLPQEIENSLGIRFRLIPPGSFLMGSPTAEPGHRDCEGPHHRVEIGYPLWVSTFPVTQGEWMRVRGGKNPARFVNAGDSAPMESVSWFDCQEFIRRLCESEDVELGTYRLLSEAEWEYSCRAGTETALYNGDIHIQGTNNAPALDDVAWYRGNSGVDYADAFFSFRWPEKQYPHTRAGTHPVGLKRPNAWGLHDMLGNVWEWVEDDWHESYKPNPPTNGSAWVDHPRSPRRVQRGGSWYSDASSCRSTFRRRFVAGLRLFYYGLRLARTVRVPH